MGGDRVGGLREFPQDSRHLLAKRVAATGVAIGLSGWFLFGGAFGSFKSGPQVIGASDASAEVAGTWVAEGVAFTAAPTALQSGRVMLALEMPSDGETHNVVLEGHGSGRPLLQAGAAGRYVATVDLAEGTYTYWCNIRDHRTAGMQGEVTIH